MKKALCAVAVGNNAKVVDCEVAYVRALPSFSIVGLANNAIQESRDRVKSALSSLGFSFPVQKVTVNLSPSDVKKDGSHFDLVIALLIYLYNENINFEDYFIFGELGLNGRVKDSAQIFSIILSLASAGLVNKVVIPKESLEKVSTIPDIEIYVVTSLEECIDLFKTEVKTPSKQREFEYDFIQEGDEKYYFQKNYELDFKDIKDQEVAKRAALISAVGMHNIWFEGSPGCGKSMSAKRLQYILAPMSKIEILDKAKLEILDTGITAFTPQRSFRSPHHSSSKPSIFGGGSHNERVGEVALANAGILFFDEFPHFEKGVLEALREPLEDNKILISRVNFKVEYKTNFLFIAASNPCPCGNLNSTRKDCRCTDIEVLRYKNKISDPLTDRIDIFVKMDEISENAKSTVTSQDMHQAVIESFLFRLKRGQKEFNSKIKESDVSEFCPLNDDLDMLLNQAITKFGMSLRGRTKVLKIARSIADIDKSNNIDKKHILEALSYRNREGNR